MLVMVVLLINDDDYIDDGALKKITTSFMISGFSVIHSPKKKL